MRIALLFALFAFPCFLPAQCGPEVLKEKRDFFKADILKPDTFCNAFIFRSAQTKKWGAANDETIFIKPEFDSIRDIGGTGYYFSWKTGKVSCWFIENSGTPIYTGDDMRFYNYGGNYYLRVKKDGKWGQVEVESRILLIPFVYETPDFPGMAPYNALEREDLPDFYLKLHADRVVFDSLNQEGDFLARNSETKKWGMYMGWRKNEMMIPPVYDSIILTKGPFVILKKDGKYGVFLDPFLPAVRKESVPCIYDDMRLVQRENNMLVLLVKKNGQWGAIDWFNGKAVVDFKYTAPDEVPLDEIPESEYYK